LVPNLKVGDQSPPVSTVVAPMPPGPSRGPTSKEGEGRGEEGRGEKGRGGKGRGTARVCPYT